LLRQKKKKREKVKIRAEEMIESNEVRIGEMTKISNKTEFILAFAAIIIGIGAFGPNLKSTQIDLGFRTFSLWELALTSFSLLCISIYVYAIDSIRYGLSFLEGRKIFKHLQRVAHLVYFLAITSPLVYVFIWLLVALLELIPSEEIMKRIDIISLIGSVVAGAVAVISALLQLRVKEKIEDELLGQEAAKLTLETDDLINKRKWRLVAIESFRLLELMMRSKARELGLEQSKLPFIRLVKIFVNKGIISKMEAAKLDYVRELRNLAVHSEKKIKKEEALYITKVVNEVSDKLVSYRIVGAYLEEEVLSALSGENGLFPRHHIFPQYNVGEGKYVDVKAGGPDHDYYIEIKGVETKSHIRQAVRQLQTILRGQDRGLLVLPISAEEVEIKDPRVKVLFFDLQKQTFSNREEVYRWIYKEKSKKKS